MTKPASGRPPDDRTFRIGSILLVTTAVAFSLLGCNLSDEHVVLEPDASITEDADTLAQDAAHDASPNDTSEDPPDTGDEPDTGPAPNPIDPDGLHIRGASMTTLRSPIGESTLFITNHRIEGPHKACSNNLCLTGGILP